MEKKETMLTQSFEAHYGDYYEKICVKKGDIKEVICWEADSQSVCRSYHRGFVPTCLGAIRFIASHNEPELRKLFMALSDGVYKDYCRSLLRNKR